MTATEAALQALIAALDSSPGLPTVRRSALLDDTLESVDSEDIVSTALVLQDGDAETENGELCIGFAGNRFALVHHAELEWIVASNDATLLGSTFDAGLEAIAAAISADRTLGGAVLLADLRRPPERGLRPLGARTAKTASIIVTLEFTSSQPF
ncbi:hypothetical protein A1351_15505 [Methylosinus sp. R-45379]|uniref:hypothetical protein n=1 Tax=Methylosinus sp. R-45379 TaxID=980563 RepID=UPI0007C98549|nr:hypothetical protein [Methylosinus sp. R-45379]OAI25957.1 hypothetical protein A1351_15505 [Methylosinus sp. R-45379]